MRLSLIIATYNEAENIKELVERIDKSLFGIKYEIIIVDDSSPDGTGKLAEELSTSYPIRVIHRKKRGIGSARLTGFKHAKYEVLGLMDADFHHPPEKLPKLLTKINGAEIVIASRTANKKANRITKIKNLKKRAVSKVASILAKLFFPSIKNIKDPLSGFFLVKKKVMKKINFELISCEILLEILIKGGYRKIEQVPYVFGERKSGKSKLGVGEYVNYLKHLIKLKCGR